MSSDPDVSVALKQKDCRNVLVRADIDLNKILEGILTAGSRQEMDSLLASSRRIFSLAEQHLEMMESLLSQISSPKEKDTLKTEAEQRAKQFKTLQAEIRSAVVQRLAALDKQQRSELLDESGGTNPSNSKNSSDAKNNPGVRNYMTQAEMATASSQGTEDLVRIRRNLVRQVEQSGESIQTLATSSETLGKINDEYQSMGSTIQQGGRLIDKYGRRQFTDKILITLGFAFFFLVCAYIVNKRLFGGFNWFTFFLEFFFPSNAIPEMERKVRKEL
ncbi:vesicle transport protein SEC20-like isoform X2 [Paramacrobiotus metropolitanus]|nr:vesicle transport protein SEC20-like isoform X2 [Paramacrobiotus metropolitanus]XP_055346891.1 vesicle transport protein SEC20-like isoform X2 [Paramacrobiotus metropolitanus]XP_055346898.1 vesicle transport protein SEC20-like isoform X2 [Paramacrobiotus metropolitanus]